MSFQHSDCSSSITLFCFLGTWQLYRLQWKQDLISEINTGLKSSPVKYSNKINKNYQRVVLEGKYDFNNQIYLYSLNEKGQQGFDVITPFETTEKKNVLINRGWIKKNYKNKSQINPLGEKKIQGLLKKNTKKNIFKPENDIKKNLYQRKEYPRYTWNKLWINSNKNWCVFNYTTCIY